MVRTRRCREDPPHQQDNNIGICTHSTARKERRKKREERVSTDTWIGAWCMHKCCLASYNLWFFARNFCIQQNATFFILVGVTIHWFTQHRIDVQTRDFAFAMATEALFERWAVETGGTTEQGLDNFQLPHLDFGLMGRGFRFFVIRSRHVDCVWCKGVQEKRQRRKNGERGNKGMGWVRFLDPSF